MARHPPFYVAAVPGFVLTIREPVRGSQETYNVDASAPIDRPYRRILATPTLWWIILSGATVNFAAYAIGTFLPSLMIRYHHVNVAQAGLVVAVVLGATGLVGLLFGGSLADNLHSAFPRDRQSRLLGCRRRRER